MATKKILSGLFFAIIAFLIFLPATSFAKGSASGTMIVSVTGAAKPKTLQISKATVKNMASDETIEIRYNPVSDIKPLIEITKKIIRDQFVETITIIF
ncbi:MAG: hypothetical protein PHN19_02045 [Patescibacteria group bacterium]|nr:hypothetical protein [Patescibacteria group bacterium]